MNDNAASLDRLHDIVLPDPVPWWPPAPGWYVVFAVVLCLVAACAVRWWRNRRADAYRRAALRELASANSAAEISELLRRVALAIAPRHTVAAQLGSDWPQWLADRVSQPVPQSVRRQLTVGVYAQSDTAVDLSELREFAAFWIARHTSPINADHRSSFTESR